MTLHDPLHLFKTDALADPGRGRGPVPDGSAHQSLILAREQEGRSVSGQSWTSTWVLAVPLRIFLAAGWLRAAAEKIVDERWLHGDGVRSFLATERPVALPFARPVMDKLLQPGAVVVAVVVLVAEIFSGLAIATGRCLRAGLWTGVVANVAFVACGRVNPSVFYLVMEVCLMLAIAEGTLGRTNVRSSPSPVPAAIAAIAGLAMLPFIRTLQPAALIADPGAMLAFLGLIVGVGNGLRWAAARPLGSRSRTLASRLISWSHSQPRPIPVGIERAALPFAPVRQHQPHPLLRPSSSDDGAALWMPPSGEGSTA